MHKALNAFQTSMKEKIEAKRKSVLTVDGQTVVANLKGKEKTFDDFWEDADMAVIDDAYRRAARIFSPDICRTYVDHLASKVIDKEQDPEAFLDEIVEARVTVAGLGLVTEVQAYFDTEADKVAQAWFQKYAYQIKNLTDARKESYRQLIEMSSEPQDVSLFKPEARYEGTKFRENDKVTPLPTWKNHLLCNEDGNFPAELNDWERKVVETESKRKGFSFWYRNPQQPGQSSLGIAYVHNEQYRIVRPDFLFFAEQNGEVVVDLVDPHGLQFADALPKLRGLATYAESHAGVYRRIESVAEVKGKLRVLNLTDDVVRKAVASSNDVEALFASSFGSDYE
jgi:hypothetical protein